MQIARRISLCLSFDHQAEAAANHYVGIFPNSKITQVSRYSEAGHEIHGRPPGSVMMVAFELDGQSYTALNGGPFFKFSEGISLQVNCENQAELDHYWERLGRDGDPAAQQCGWLKDKYGVSWQVVPTIMEKMFDGTDQAASDRVMTAMLQMKKLDVKRLEQAYAG